MINASKIVIGTWSLSGDYGYVKPDIAKDVLMYCHEKGLDEFDTAPVYGRGKVESYLGEVFEGYHDVKINTKTGNSPSIGKSFDVDDLKKTFENSLQRLRRSSINSLFLHNPRDEVESYDDVCRFMLGLKEDRLINEVGLSKAKDYNYSVDFGRFDVVQDDVNLLHMGPVLHKDKSDNVFMARSPLANGILSGSMSKYTVFSGDDHRAGWLKGERLRSIMKRVDKIKEICGENNISSISKRFVFFHPNVDKTIIGVKSKEHVDKILYDIEQGPLEDDVFNELVRLYKKDFFLKNEKTLRY